MQFDLGNPKPSNYTVCDIDKVDCVLRAADRGMMPMNRGFRSPCRLIVRDGCSAQHWGSDGRTEVYALQ